MLYRAFQLLVALVPLAGFALALQPVQERMFGGQATQGLLLLLAVLAVLAVVEGLLFRYWILPRWGDKVAERLYAGSYLPENDALAQLAERIMNEKGVRTWHSAARYGANTVRSPIRWRKSGSKI